MPRKLFRFILFGFGLLLAASTAATLACFPWATDPEGDRASAPVTSDYYRRAYASKEASAPLSEREMAYVETARKAAARERVPGTVAKFVEKYGLNDKRVLEVGAGSGLLQDHVADYTGLDISPSAARFFHKPFVEASATAMPFKDSSFDAIWTIWVLEHIPNPERALLEMRRVVKPGGLMLMHPAFDVDRYFGQGYAVRPYSDFGWKGKIVKATQPIAYSSWFHLLYYHQVRLLRSITARIGSGPSRFHFQRLEANYEKYWQADSDACTGLSYHETYLWFHTRGDECLNCPPESRLITRDTPAESYLIIRVKK